MRRASALVAAGTTTIAMALAGCGSGSASSSTSASQPTTGTATTAHTTAATPRETVAACLGAHGVPAAQLPPGLGLRTRGHAGAKITILQSRRLERVGTSCDPTLTRTQFLEIAAVELCLRDESVRVPRESTPLAELLPLTTSTRLLRRIGGCRSQVATH